jgi:HTH-type transcriptional regulator / antitoxin HigA
VGVALVLTPELKGTHLSGAVRWVSSNKVLLQLSLRHKSDDQFWFSFFHELGHILRPGRHANFIDSTERADLDERQLAAEEDADLFARGTLIPQTEYDEFVSQRNYSGAAIKQFSKDLGVASGIVVGRLQRDGYVHPAQLNSLKRALRWN